MLLLINLNSIISFAALIKLLILNLILILLLLVLQLVLVMRDLESRGVRRRRGYWAKGLRRELILGGDMLLVWYLEISGETPCGGGLDISVLSSKISLGWKELFYLICGP